jgi:hypothetical protein
MILPCRTPNPGHEFNGCSAAPSGRTISPGYSFTRETIAMAANLSRKLATLSLIITSAIEVL